jgi:hypothetical protein
MGEIVKLKTEAKDRDPGDRNFFDDDKWCVGMIRRHDGYSITLSRDAPGFWRWDITYTGDRDILAHAARSFPNRHDARADAWRGLRRLVADAAKGGSR